jgi:hypothetical protein
MVAGVLACTGPATTSPAVAAPQAKMQSDRMPYASDTGARRHHRRAVRHYAYRPDHQPYYYGRPTYYRPYPYRSPAPFTFGIGFGPSWW